MFHLPGALCGGFFFFFSISDNDQSVLLTGESVSVILKSSCGNAVHMAHTHNTRKEMTAGLPAVSCGRHVTHLGRCASSHPSTPPLLSPRDLKGLRGHHPTAPQRSTASVHVSCVLW